MMTHQRVIDHNEENKALMAVSGNDNPWLLIEPDDFSNVNAHDANKILERAFMSDLRVADKKIEDGQNLALTAVIVQQSMLKRLSNFECLDSESIPVREKLASRINDHFNLNGNSAVHSYCSLPTINPY